MGWMAMCQAGVLKNHQEWEPSMSEITTIGLDIAKLALGKTIRAMADGTLDSQVGSRICNGLGIMRQCLETQTPDRLGERQCPRL